MKKRIITYLSDNPLVRKFMKGPSSARLVLMADILIVVLSCFITYTFSPTATIGNYGWFYTSFAQGLVCAAVYTMWMFVVHTYRYIVRLSVVEDMYRVVVLVAVSTLSLLALWAASYLSDGIRYLGLWNIFVVMLLTFSMLMFMRLAIKYIYRQLSNTRYKRTRVIALGSNDASFAFATNLNNDPESKFVAVAMMTLSPDKNIKSINDVPVVNYDPATLAEIFSEYGCKDLIFPSSQLKFMRAQLADEFLKHHIKLHMYTHVQEMNSDDNSPRVAGGNIRTLNIEDLLGRDVIKPDTTEAEIMIRGQVVMITGAAGSIGSEIVNQVANLKAAEIVLLDQAETPMHELQLQMEAAHPETKIHLFIADIANRGRLEQAFSRYKPRYVFHAAAYKHVPMMERNPSEAIATNVFGTKNVADLSVKYRVEKFVMISTDKAVNPTNVMGASKRIAEIYVQSLFYYNLTHNDRRSTEFITTRFGNVLGSNGSVIPLFRKQIEQGGPLTVTQRDIIRYFMTIPEACSLVLQAATMGHGGEIFVFDMGQPVKIYDLATRMISLSGLRPGIDIEIIETGLRPGEKLYEELLNDKEVTLPTRNRKIMIAKVRKYAYADVIARLDILENLTLAGDYHDIVAEMKHIVPEFKSKNSRWESIDKEVANDEVIKEVVESAQ